MSTVLNTGLGLLAGSKIEIMISCTNLADLDDFTKSDPMCVLFVRQFGQWKEYDRTEAIRNSLNPQFVKSFILEFEPGLTQQLMFSVYDIDSRSQDLKHHDYVGSVEDNLHNLIDDNKLMKTTNKNLRIPGHAKSRGLISITTEVIKESRNKVSIHVGGHKLDKKGVLSLNKPDTYFQISRCIDGTTGSTYHPVYRTEIVYKSTRPRWRPFEINLQPLCNSDLDRGIQFSVWHFSGNDYHLVGRNNTTLREMSQKDGNGSFIEVYLSSPKKETKNKKNTLAGTLRFFRFKIDMQYSLFDFIRGGLQIQPVVAIDFTASNGAIEDDLSLHSLSNARENQYMDAMDTLGAMICQYNIEQQIALFGFGANWKNKQEVSHCFPLCEDVFVKGIKNAISQYEGALPLLHFSGPTQLAPMLEKAASLAESQNMSQNKQIYTVLMVITDGVINDIKRTLRKLIAISHLPLSVIFIGVGPADFSLMEQFHVDRDTPLQNRKTGEVAVRTNTYFIAFHKENISTGGNAVLAKEAMAALSTQIIQYMKKNNLTPNKPKLIRNELLESFTDDQPKLLPKSTSKASLISVKTTGPSCPTCGAQIEPGSQIYSDILNSSVT
ncbi:copine-3-like [Saccostrea echinata]|uniref:copine-3-like n=1 Tax=Saccostrea echinata TaxID=191078 RepID=UPI002A825B69|nr:copine-3-like [Saccostrea echinata]